MAEVGAADEHGGHGLRAQRESEAGLHETRGIALLDEGLEGLGALYVRCVVRTGGDRSHGGNCHGMPGHLAAQRAGGEDADADRPHLFLAGKVEKTVEILGGIAQGHLMRSGRVQHVEADLSGVDGAARQRAVQRARLTEGRDAEEADLALLLQAAGRGRHGIQDLPHTQSPLSRHTPDRVVQMKEIETLEPEQLEAVLDRAGERPRHVGQVGQAALAAHDHLRAQRAQHDAQIALRFSAAIRGRGVQVVDAELDRARDGPLAISRRAAHHQPAHVAAPEGERGDLEPCPAQRPVVHLVGHGDTLH